MKDVLEYTEEELEKLSTDELKRLHTEANDLTARMYIQQITKKILINALYGASANKYFPLYNPDFAAGITSNGRYFIQKCANYIEDTFQKMLPYNGKYIIYGDTDSVYFTVEPFVNKYKEKHPDADLNKLVDFCDDFADKIVQPVVDKCINDMTYDLNSYDKDRIKAKREVVCDVMVNAAKKKYYARVRDSEGTRYPADNPHIKVMGLELAKSTTPTWVKEKLNEAIPLLFDASERDLDNWINKIKNEYTSVSLDEISQVGNANRLDYDLNDKGVPILSRAGIVYNNYIRDNHLDDTFSYIEPSSKFKYLRLGMPNEFNSDAVGYLDVRFAEKYLRKYIDYDLMFEKSFLSPLSLMCECMGYNLFKKSEALEDW